MHALGSIKCHSPVRKENNPDLLVSIDSAMTVNGTNQKDKSGEKLAESEEYPLESHTDGSDAFDTLCIAVETGQPSASGGGGGFAYISSRNICINLLPIFVA